MELRSFSTFWSTLSSWPCTITPSPRPSQHAAVHLQRLYLRLQLLHLLLVHGQDVRLLPVALRHSEAVPAQVDVLLYLAELVSLKADM